ncbi:MAG: hypothetical protein K2J40_05760 [Ruminococcus sp.]|nr:hypothetical protein [Ruminococcus sp.]
MKPETKVQIEALKRLEKGQPVHYEKGENFTYLSVDGKSIIRISYDNFFLDMAKITESSVLAKHLDVDYSWMYTLENITDIYYDKKGFEIFFCNETNHRIYADKKIFKLLISRDSRLYTDETSRFMYFVRNKQVYAVMILVQFCDKEGETVAD